LAEWVGIFSPPNLILIGGAWCGDPVLASWTMHVSREFLLLSERSSCGLGALARGRKDGAQAAHAVHKLGVFQYDHWNNISAEAEVTKYAGAPTTLHEGRGLPSR